MAKAIEVENVNVAYGSGNTEVRALRDASLVVEEGQVVALLGPSGAGKSTLLKVLGLIQRPASGRVTIGGQLVMDGPEPLVDTGRFRRRTLGFVFQRSNLIGFLSAVDNVQLVMELDGTDPATARTRALELLDYLGVADRADSSPAALSGGQ